eukprot:5584652-Pyramimonas_sp.AAC.1
MAKDQSPAREQALELKWIAGRALRGFAGHWMQGPRATNDEMGSLAQTPRALRRAMPLPSMAGAPGGR